MYRGPVARKKLDASGGRPALAPASGGLGSLLASASHTVAVSSLRSKRRSTAGAACRAPACVYPLLRGQVLSRGASTAGRFGSRGSRQRVSLTGRHRPAASLIRMSDCCRSPWTARQQTFVMTRVGQFGKRPIMMGRLPSASAGERRPQVQHDTSRTQPVLDARVMVRCVAQAVLS